MRRGRRIGERKEGRDPCLIEILSPQLAESFPLQPQRLLLLVGLGVLVARLLEQRIGSEQAREHSLGLAGGLVRVAPDITSLEQRGR